MSKYLNILLAICISLMIFESNILTIEVICPVKASPLPGARILGYSTPAIAEPSFPTPDDKDGEPPTTGSADPSEFVLEVKCVVDSLITDVSVTLLNTDHDPLGTETPDVVDYQIDDDNPKTFTQLTAGTYYFYWSIDKLQSASLRDHAEQYQVELAWTGPGPAGSVVSDIFNVVGEQSSSVSQNDLRTMQIYPSSVTSYVGDTFTAWMKWEEQSSSLYALSSEIYFKGSILRLTAFSLYYYNTNGTDPGDLSLGLPPGADATFDSDTYLDKTQLSALPDLSRGDYWIGKYNFEAMAPGTNTLLPYAQTKLSRTANWKIGWGEIPVTINMKEPGVLMVDKIMDRLISGCDPPVYGHESVYELMITIQNAGGSAVTNVNVTDKISPDVTFVGLTTPTEGTATYLSPPPNITWTGLDLDPGEHRTLSFQAKVPSTASPGVVHLNLGIDLYAIGIETATYQTIEDYGDHDIDEIVVPPVVLTVDKAETGVVSGPDPPIVGSTTRYNVTIFVVNSGGSDASNVVVTDAISPQVTNPAIVSYSKGSASYSSGVITWTVGTLSHGTMENLTFQVSVTPTQEGPVYLNYATDLNATGTHSATGCPLTDTGDHDVTEYALKPSAPGLLTVDKTETGVVSGPDPPIVGSTTRYEITMTVQNIGGSTLENLNVTDQASSDPQVTFVSVGTPSQGILVGTPPPIIWNVGSLDPGENATLTFQVDVKPIVAGTVYLNFANDLYTNGTDTSTGQTIEDYGDHDVREIALAHGSIAVDKKADGVVSGPHPPIVGGVPRHVTVYWINITVTNTGDTTEYKVNVTDRIPTDPQISWVGDMSASTGTYSYNLGVITWNVGDMSPGASEWLRYKLKVTPDVAGDIVLNWGYDLLSNSTDTSDVGDHNVVKTAVDAYFYISSTPALRTIGPGDTTTYEITLKACGCFEGEVTLDAPGLSGTTDLSYYFTPASVTFTPGEKLKTSTLWVTTSVGTPYRYYRVTVEGTSTWYTISENTQVLGIPPPTKPVGGVSFSASVPKLVAAWLGLCGLVVVAVAAAVVSRRRKP